MHLGESATMRTDVQQTHGLCHIKNYGPAEIRIRTYCLINICPNLTAEIIYLKVKIVGKKYTDKKRNNLDE